MKRLFLLAAIFSGLAASAQIGTPNVNAIQNEGRAPYRTQFISYDIRKEADSGDPNGTKYFRALMFKLNATSRFTTFEANADIPALWLERDVYIRDEGRTGRYRLKVNGREAGVNSDSYGTNDFYITPYLKDGTNLFSLEFTADIPGEEMESYNPDQTRLTIENLSIYSQPKIHIYDYRIAGYPTPERGDAELALDIILVNGYNMAESVNIGYDIYDPKGNLKEYNFLDVVIPGLGHDTIRFRDKIIGTEKHIYSADRPELYKVMLTLKYEGRPTEYIPIKVGFGTTQFDGDNVLRNGKPIHISAVMNDVPTQKNCLRNLRLLKQRGINTLYLTRPQQQWFYDMCEQTGLYVIDCAAVQCDLNGGDRGPNGMVANNPAHVSRFIDRQQNIYHRNKNRSNVIGWSIGAESGNGYNMYKSYQWMKAADSTRIVVYRHAEGEWNTDMELPAPQSLERLLEGVTTK